MFRSNRSTIGICIVCAIALSLCSTALAQTTYYVDATCGDDAWAGTSPTCSAPDGPFATIQTAINAAVNGDTVILADGTYTGAGNRELDFLGKAITLQSANGPANCRISAYDQVLGAPYPVAKFVTGEDPNTVVEGINLSQGEVDLSGTGFFAGGVTCIGASPSFLNCWFTSNNSYHNGEAGAVYCQNGSPSFENCEFKTNAGMDRSVMYCEDGSPSFSNCTFDDNGELAGGDEIIEISGAASHPTFNGCTFLEQALFFGRPMIRVTDSAQTTIDDCSFSGGGSHGLLIAGSGTNVNLMNTNFSNAWVLGVSINNGTIVNCVFSDLGSDIGGSALRIGGTATVSDSRIISNYSNQSAGLAVLSGADVTIDRCIIAENSVIEYPAEGAGGFIANNATCLIRNSFITDNNASAIGDAAGKGGGLFVADNGNLTVENCTVANNSAFQVGGAIRGNATIYNSIVWGNSPDQFAGGTVTATYSDVQGGMAGTGNIDADPVFLDDANGDYHITSASPCINAGDPNTVVDPNDTDFEGDPRIINGVIEMGADESDLNNPCIGLSSTSFAFVATAGGPNPASQQLDISNNCGGTLNWTATPDCAWLTPNPSSDSALPLETDAVALMVDITGLAVGAHECTLTVSDPNALNDPQTVDLSLDIGGTIHVPADYATIQDAVDAAIDGVEIIVADGTYTGVGNRSISIIGKALTIRSENGPAGCIIDCESAGRGMAIDDIGTGNTLIDGFTIQNGNTTGGGGAISCFNAPATIQNCVLTNCHSDGSGGGIFAGGTDVHLLNCEITGNTSNNASAVYFGPGNVGSIQDCLISGNVSTGNGGVTTYYASVQRCTIAGNQSSGAGVGGIYQIRPRIEDCMIMNNTVASSTAGTGGYGCASEGTNNLYIRRCVVQGNQGGRAGGMTLRGTFTIENTIVHDNTGELIGGGILINDDESLTFKSCAITQNTAPDGSGVYVNDAGASMTFIGCTIADNSNYGISIDGDVTVLSSIVWGNASGSFENATLMNLVTQWSDVEGGAGGPGNIDADPMFVNAAGGDYHIASGSPCYNAGDPNYVADPNELDIDGNARILNGRIEMGADEFTADGDFDGDGDVDLSDFSQFSLCFGGPNLPPAASCPPGVDADFDNDGDVDLGDFSAFSLNFTGPL